MEPAKSDNEQPRMSAQDLERWLDARPDVVAQLRENIAAAERGEMTPLRDLDGPWRKGPTKPS